MDKSIEKLAFLVPLAYPLLVQLLAVGGGTASRTWGIWGRILGILPWCSDPPKEDAAEDQPSLRDLARYVPLFPALKRRTIGERPSGT